MMKKIYKSVLLSMLCLSVICFLFPSLSYADVALNIGDYIQFGKYNNESIIWRYVDNDDNGKLIVSDKVITFKCFDSFPVETDFEGGHWGISTIRSWLNSTADTGDVVWPQNNPPISRYYGQYSYNDESGFLHANNFSSLELSLVKSITQWTMLPEGYLELSENGLNSEFSRVKVEGMGGSGSSESDYIQPIYYEFTDVPNIYYGAALQTTDKMFLLDDLQLYRMYENFGSVNADYTDVSALGTDIHGIGVYHTQLRLAQYYLRGGFTSWEYDNYAKRSAVFVGGIRPAFYLNETAVSGMTGSGTAEDPYILIPDPDYISVEVNGEAVAFDVAPVMESDRVLVPMRAIFEDLGATVEWEGETETVTATKDNTVITLQINNNVMTKNGEEIILDVPARLVGDRTLVPIRAVAEGLDATVDWIDEENKVVITK